MVLALPHTAAAHQRTGHSRRARQPSRSPSDPVAAAQVVDAIERAILGVVDVTANDAVRVAATCLRRVGDEQPVTAVNAPPSSRRHSSPCWCDASA